MEEKAREKFLSEFVAASTGLSASDLERTLDRVTVKFTSGNEVSPSFGDDEVYLSKIVSPDPQKGLATKALTTLFDMADRHGVYITLHSEPIDDRSGDLSRQALYDFYKKRGFVKCGPNDMMTRAPKQPHS